MSRFLFALVLGLTASLSAADFRGRWAGTVTNAAGENVPVHLTLNQSDDAMAGNVVIGDAGAVPVDNVVIRGDELRFTIGSRPGQVTDFMLTFVVSGRPLDQKVVHLYGSAKAADEDSKVTLYPVRDDGLPDRTVFGTPPVPVQIVDPRYTPDAREAKLKGTVTVQVEVDETGIVSKEQIRVVRSLGYGLDEAAIDCVKLWRFTPAYKNGWAVKSPLLIGVNFRGSDPPR